MADTPTNQERGFNPRQTEVDIAIRREEVARLYHRERMSMYAIAARLGVSVMTISRDVDAIEEAAVTAMEKEGRRMVASLDRQLNGVLDEAWAAYEKSKQPAVESISQRVAGGNGKGAGTGEKSLVKLLKKNQTGDPRYLAVIIAAAEKLAKLHRLGGFVSEPSIHVPVGPGGNVVIYIPDNGRTKHTPPQNQPMQARTIEANTSPVVLPNGNGH